MYAYLIPFHSKRANIISFAKYNFHNGKVGRATDVTPSLKTDIGSSDGSMRVRRTRTPLTKNPAAGTLRMSVVRLYACLWMSVTGMTLIIMASDKVHFILNFPRSDIIFFLRACSLWAISFLRYYANGFVSPSLGPGIAWSEHGLTVDCINIPF